MTNVETVLNALATEDNNIAICDLSLPWRSLAFLQAVISSFGVRWFLNEDSHIYT